MQRGENEVVVKCASVASHDPGLFIWFCTRRHCRRRIASICVKLSLLLDSVFAIGFCCRLLSLLSFAELIVLAEIVWLGRE